MSTRSVVAAADGDAWSRGRYTHWDGYPSARGAGLWALVARDGVEKVLQVLTVEHHGWSVVDPTYVPGSRPNHLGAERSDEVAGYGIAFSATEQPDEWVEFDGDDWGTEWSYALGEGGLLVCERQGYPDRSWAPVLFAKWDDPEPNWNALEQRLGAEAEARYQATVAG